MELVISIIVSTFFFLLGWIINEPYRIPNWISLNKNKGLSGQWNCMWRETNKTSEWVKDKVVIKKKIGKIHIKVTEAGDKYKWKFIGKAINDIIVGEGKSLKQDSFSVGNMTLKISPQGNIMCGFAISPTDERKLIVTKMIFYKDDVDVLKIIKNFNNYI